MDFMKKGPEIKLSELKVPQVVSDLYWDLKDRYLLPAVVVLLVAIVAVPLIVGGSSDSSLQEAVEEGGVVEEVAGMSAVPPASGELVAKAAPGLRDYRRRLDELQEKDPFVQQFTGGGEGTPATTSGGEVSSSSSGSVTSTEGSSASPETFSPSPTTEPVPDEPSSDSPGITWFSYAMDVRVVSLGEAGSSRNGANESNTTVRRNLPELTVLPSRDAPAAIYMGVTKDGGKALMMISDQVQGIFGDAKCVLGSTSCQLLAVEPGLPVTIVYGPAERTFRIEVLKLRLLNTDHLNRAPLGSDRDKKKSGNKNSVEGLAQLAPRP